MREAVELASFLAMLLAPIMAGVLIDAQGGVGEPINGLSALVGAVLEMPGTLAMVWIVFYGFGRAVRSVSWSSALFLIIAAAVVGGGVALFRLDAIGHLATREGHAALGLFLLAGALTGTAYAWLIWFWDRLLRELAE